MSAGEGICRRCRCPPYFAAGRLLLALTKLGRHLLQGSSLWSSPDEDLQEVFIPLLQHLQVRRPYFNHISLGRPSEPITSSA